MLLAPLLLWLFAQPAIDAAKPASPALAGVVVDSAGKSLPGVDLWLSTGLPPSGDRPLIGGVMWGRSGRTPFVEYQAALAHAQTDSDGHFRLEIPDEIVRSQEPLPVAVWAHVPPGGLAAKHLPWAIPAPGEPIHLVVEKRAAAGFRIMGSDGTPEEGARVSAMALERALVPRQLADRLASVTRAGGTVVLPGFAPGDVRWVRVDSPRFGTQILRLPGPNTMPASEFRLEPAGRISGRIVASGGGPISGLRSPGCYLSPGIRPWRHARIRRGNDRCKRAI